MERAAGTRGTVQGEAAEPGRAASAHRLYAQLAWPTLGGLPLFGDREARALERELIALCLRLDVEPLEVRVSADRAQVLVRFFPGQALTDVARRLKSASLVTLQRRGSPARWGRGFAASTVGPAQVHRMVRRLRAERPEGRDAGAAAARDGAERRKPGSLGAGLRPRRPSSAASAGG